MGIKVILSKEEASSKVLEPIPSGYYKVAITDVELRESKSLKNAGKPYYAIEHTVQEGDHEGRKVFSNVMLFAGALYSLNQLLNGLGIDTEAGEIEVPEPEELLGRELWAKVKITPARKVKDEKTGEMKEYEPRNDIAGYKSLTAGAPNANVKPGSSSLLPS
jgi:hypothetical protein